MKAEFIKKEGNQVEFTVTIDNDTFNKGIEKAYNQTKHKFNISGFRKGKAPRKIIEMNYGKGVFFEDAIEIVLADEYIRLYWKKTQNESKPFNSKFPFQLIT